MASWPGRPRGSSRRALAPLLDAVARRRVPSAGEMRREWSQGGTAGDWDRLVVISPRGAASPSCSFLPSSDPCCFRAIIYPLPAIFGQAEVLRPTERTCSGPSTRAFAR